MNAPQAYMPDPIKDKERKTFFRKRSLTLIAMVIGYFALSTVSANYVGFDFMNSFMEVPFAVS